MTREWAPHGVTVNAIAPGYIETNLTADHLAKPVVREGLVELVPAGRLGTRTWSSAPFSSSVSPVPASSPDMSSTSMADAPSCEVRIALGALLVPIDDQATAREVAGRLEDHGDTQ